MNPIVTVIRDLALSAAKDAFRRASEEWQRIEAPPGEALRKADSPDQGATARLPLAPGARVPDRRDPARQVDIRPAVGMPERRAAPSSTAGTAGAAERASPAEASIAKADLPALFGPRTAAVERTLIAASPHAAAQELYTVLRSLPPDLAGAFLSSARPSLAAIVTHLCERPAADPAAAGKTETAVGPPAGDAVAPGASPGFGAAATTRTLANVAAILDAGAGTAEVRTFARDLGAIVLGGKNANEAAIFFGLAQAVAVGTGLLLPLTIAAQLEERGERRRRQGLIALLAASIGRLGGRIDGVHAEILAIAGPLLLAWTGWRSRFDGEDRAAELNAFLAAHPDLLPSLADGLERFERAGRDAVRVLDDLSRGPPDPSLRAARDLLLTSDAAQRAIAGSLTAHRHVLVLAEQRHAEDGLTLEAVQLVFTGIGFPLDRAAFLAETAWLTQQDLPLGSGWTRLESLEAIRGGGLAFQRLLAFLNGRFVVPAHVELLDFSDIDPSGRG